MLSLKKRELSFPGDYRRGTKEGEDSFVKGPYMDLVKGGDEKE